MVTEIKIHLFTMPVMSRLLWIAGSSLHWRQGVYFFPSPYFHWPFSLGGPVFDAVMWHHCVCSVWKKASRRMSSMCRRIVVVCSVQNTCKSNHLCTFDWPSFTSCLNNKLICVCVCVCAAKSEGRSCEYNGRIYQNGESFRAGCKHQCTCIDGAVGCAPLCNNKLPPASSSCPYPQLVRKPGQCCFSVDCSKGSWPRLPKHQVCFLSIRLSVHLLYMGFVFHKLLFT